MKYVVSCIAVLLFASVSFAGSFAGTPDPRLDRAVALAKQDVTQEGGVVEGVSCIMVHALKKAVCNVYVKGETEAVRATIPYEKL